MEMITAKTPFSHSSFIKIVERWTMYKSWWCLNKNANKSLWSIEKEKKKNHYNKKNAVSNNYQLKIYKRLLTIVIMQQIMHKNWNVNEELIIDEKLKVCILTGEIFR